MTPDENAAVTLVRARLEQAAATLRDARLLYGWGRPTA
jgi:hypothetical protein